MILIINSNDPSKTLGKRKSLFIIETQPDQFKPLIIMHIFLDKLLHNYFECSRKNKGNSGIKDHHPVKYVARHL